MGGAHLYSDPAREVATLGLRPWAFSMSDVLKTHGRPHEEVARVGKVVASETPPTEQDKQE